MRLIIDAGREMKLSPEPPSARGNNRDASLPGGVGVSPYESSIFQTLYDLRRELADNLLMRVAG